MESLVAKHLTDNKGCVYVTNSEYPSEVRKHMLGLGIPDSLVNSSKLLFIDSYSAMSGLDSTEEFQVPSHTDLTALSMEITKCLERLGPQTDVYLDSATITLNSLRADYLLTFLQSIAGKVKSTSGKLVVTLGTGIDKLDIMKLEENSDCVIETELQDSSRGQTRRLRIKKLRDSSYNDRWTLFRIETGKGIIFLTQRM